MLYAVICRDKPGHLQVRLDTRADHLAYIEKTGIVKMAGPFIEGGQMCGSLVILDTGDLASAEAWAAGDPYKAAGLFDSVTVTEWKKVIG
ncbi:MAG TPA: YciI family protein [Albidovulum sp.]|uniref:YciI family protein n=1 Tax=Albidovulum sp. TaxID=1872424 RepID=UPI002BD28B45|nr:YciI family protein [Albidovulum sp.]